MKLIKTQISREMKSKPAKTLLLRTAVLATVRGGGGNQPRPRPDGIVWDGIGWEGIGWDGVGWDGSNWE